MSYIKVYNSTIDGNTWAWKLYSENDKQEDLLKKIECLEHENRKMKVYLKNLASKLKTEVGYITADLEDYFL